LASANRQGLDHDRASDGLWTRLDVTTCLWKCFRVVPPPAARYLRDERERMRDPSSVGLM
jgi:hypothetical protein